MSVIRIQTEIAKLGLDLPGVMDYVVEQALPLIGADGTAIELAEGGEMVYRAAAGIAASHLGLRLRQDSSLSGLCVKTGVAQRCDDTEIDPRADRVACRKIGLRSMIVIPLKHGDAVVGVLKAMSREPAKFSAGDVQVLELLSDLVGASMYYAAKFDTDELFRRATHDGLTGLANRAQFLDRLRGAIAQAERKRQQIGVLMLDMDGLKQINDHHGHRAGDAVIREFASRLAKTARKSDTVARLGGDEFAMILLPVDSPRAADMAVERITRETTGVFRFEEKDFSLRASLGAAVYPEHGHDVETLLEAADQTMYAVKRGRKGSAGGAACA